MDDSHVIQALQRAQGQGLSIILADVIASERNVLITKHTYHLESAINVNSCHSS
jgi:hypothetical protein